MKKLSIKNIIEFRYRSDRGKKSFATTLKMDKAKLDIKSGGNYWVSSLSAISNSFKSGNVQRIIDKRGELEEKYEEAVNEGTQKMYKRNIDILYNYENLNLRKWKPSKQVQLLKKHKDDSILSIKGFDIQVTPNHVFTFQKNNIEEIGAIWFIAKVNGFREDELGMFTDILYRYLKTHYSKSYNLNSKYCIAVDVFNNFEINYSQLEKGEIPMILNSTLDEIKKIM